MHNKELVRVVIIKRSIATLFCLNITGSGDSFSHDSRCPSLFSVKPNGGLGGFPDTATKICDRSFPRPDRPVVRIPLEQGYRYPSNNARGQARVVDNSLRPHGPFSCNRNRGDANEEINTARRPDQPTGNTARKQLNASEPLLADGLANPSHNLVGSHTYNFNNNTSGNSSATDAGGQLNPSQNSASVPTLGLDDSARGSNRLQQEHDEGMLIKFITSTIFL